MLKTQKVFGGYFINCIPCLFEINNPQQNYDYFFLDINSFGEIQKQLYSHSIVAGGLELIS